jgi:putative ABC transport system substrate-binding protein
MPVRGTNRRAFIAGLGGAAAWPLVARAQQSGKIPRVGVLWHAGNEQEEAIYLGALQKGLNDLGYVEGKNIELVNRFADEHYDRFDALAAELVEAKVDVIVGSLPSAALAAKRASTTIPVVVAYGAEYLIRDLAHPGGNVTGLSSMLFDLAGKHLEILKDAIVNLSTVALLYNANLSISYYLSQAQKAAVSLQVSLDEVDVRSPDDLEQGFSAIAKAHADAVLLTPDGLFYQQRERIAQAALANRVPSIGWNAQFADAGMLMSYGADAPDLFRRAAIYLDKILKGVNPADLPVEQPTKFEFIINLKTAKALNLAVPPSVLARADKIIE